MYHMRSTAKEELSLGVPSIQCGGIRVNLVHKEVIIESKNVKSGIRGMPTLEKVTVR
jgi:hypothetical protein